MGSTKRVFIAEKPSLGRAIAEALPGPKVKRNGYIEVGNDVVTWCFGHMLEQVEPHVYGERFKKWNLGDLPIVPERWQLTPRKTANKQIGVIRTLLKTAGRIVHAGDPDREGQLLVDELIEYLQVPSTKRAAMLRLLVSDLNRPAVEQALQSMSPNTEFASLSQSALARSRADWLYGINMTRAYTLMGQRKGQVGVLSVGRVQTPVLGMVVRRDKEISDFVSKPFYEVEATIPYETEMIVAKWKPSEACGPYQDEEGRVTHKALAANVVTRIKGQAATVTLAKHQQTKEAPPLPFSLSALQIAAAKQYGMSATKVLECSQALYEKHKVITYPRSDCRHLPAEHFAQAASIFAAIENTAPALAEGVKAGDLTTKSKAWDDAKVGAHHAIIPTAQRGSKDLSTAEQRIYELIARQYIMQFYKAASYATGKLVFAIGPGTFEASGKQLLETGWRSLLLKEKKEKKAPFVPQLKKGTVLTCKKGRVVAKKTTAPKPFTDATILQAMTGVSRFVRDPQLRTILKETDGLGTEATRAGILETLFRRKLLGRKGKSIRATEVGVRLVEALPPAATYPDMTAQWECKLQAMVEGRASYVPFMRELEGELRATLEHSAD